MRRRGLVLGVSAAVLLAAFAAVPAASSRETEPAPSAPDPAIQALVDAVSLAQLYTYNYDLQNFTTRYFGTSGLNQSAGYLLNRFGTKANLVPESHYFTYSGQVVRNVIGVLPGFDPANETVYIMGGHYDSYSSDSNPSNLAPGADDNGSGTAATLEAARVLGDFRFNATILFIGWTAEEVGLIGSQVHAADLAAQGTRVGAVLNHDMIGYDPGNSMAYDLMSNPASAWIINLMDQLNGDYGIGLNLTLIPTSTAQNSDHAPYWAQGYPAMFASEGNFNTPNYHSQTDTVDKLNFELETRGTKLAVATLAHLAGFLVPGNGYVALDKETYGLYDQAGVRVYDTDLNADPGAVETVWVTLASDSEPGGESLLLTETGANTSLFSGSLPMRVGPPTNGLLEVQHGDVVTATYEEANPAGTRTDTARVDGFPPQIWNVAAAPGVTTATITWETDEPADSTAKYGPTPALGGVASQPDLTTRHSLFLTGLTPATTYFFEVRSVDASGNEAFDDFGGALYRFTTLTGLSTTPDYGYVGWVRHTEPTGNHFTSTEILVGHSRLRAPPAGTNYKGAAQFPTTAVPPAATITNASVQFHGARWIYNEAVKDWWLRHLNGSIDAGWTTHAYADINGSAVDLTVPPTLVNSQLAAGQWNAFYYPPGDYDVLRARLATGAVSYRIDGFDELGSSTGVIFAWLSGNDGDEVTAPRLTVTYSLTGDTVGPTVLSFAAAPNPTMAQDIVGIGGLVSDAATGGSAVVAAEAFVGADPGLGNGLPLAATDGGFDSPDETFALWLDVSGLAAGTYALSARGRDAAGNWGPVNTFALEVGGAGGVDYLPVAGLTAELAGPFHQDVQLRWTPSQDSLGGPAVIAGYTILFGEAYDPACAGYAPLTTVLPNSLAVRHYGGGDGNVRDFFYCVQVDGPDGSSTVDGTVQAGKVTRPLQAGLNLVSMPLVPLDSIADSVFQTVDHDGLWAYGAGAWSSRVPTKVTQTLDAVTISQGVWVDAAGDDYFTVAGGVPASTDIVLDVGWNLVGYPSLTPRAVQDALAGLAVLRVEAFDPSSTPYHLREMAATDPMAAGGGYWILVDAAQVWNVANG